MVRPHAECQCYCGITHQEALSEFLINGQKNVCVYLKPPSIHWVPPSIPILFHHFDVYLNTYRCKLSGIKAVYKTEKAKEKLRQVI